MVFIILCFTDSSIQGLTRVILGGGRGKQETCMGNHFVKHLTQFLQTDKLSLRRKKEDIRCSVILKNTCHLQSPITHHNAAEQTRRAQGHLESWSSPECSKGLSTPWLFWGVPNAQIYMQEWYTLVLVTQGLLCPGRIPQCPFRQFYSSYACRMMWKATEPQAQIKGLISIRQHKNPIWC